MAETVEDRIEDSHSEEREHQERRYEQGEINQHEIEVYAGPPVLPQPVGEPEDLDPPSDLPPLSEPKASKEIRFKQPPPAKTPKLKAARDSGHNEQPFPYGNKDTF